MVFGFDFLREFNAVQTFLNYTTTRIRCSMVNQDVVKSMFVNVDASTYGVKNHVVDNAGVWSSSVSFGEFFRLLRQFHTPPEIGDFGQVRPTWNWV